MSVIYCEDCANYIDTDFYEVECNEEGHDEL
jgi:hypothetical protein